MAVNMKNVSSEMLCHVALVRIDVSEERSASIIRVSDACYKEIVSLQHVSLLITANVVPSSLILVTLMMEALYSSETSVSQEPHGITSQKTAFHQAVLSEKLMVTQLIMEILPLVKL
jgi:hypothetical protein